MDMSFGTYIQQERKRRHLSQKQLANAIGTTAGFISQIERGISYPSFPLLKLLVSVLNLDANLIFHGKSDDLHSQRFYEIEHLLHKLDERQQEWIFELLCLSLRYADISKSKESTHENCDL